MTDSELLKIQTTFKMEIMQSYLSTNLTTAIIAVESSGDPAAQSSCNALGLMQITPIALKEFNDITNNTYDHNQMYSPNINILVGSWYLNRLMRHYNLSVYDALRAYNGGIGNIQKDTNQSASYAYKVLSYKNRLDKLVGVA